MPKIDQVVVWLVRHRPNSLASKVLPMPTVCHLRLSSSCFQRKRQNSRKLHFPLLYNAGNSWRCCDVCLFPLLMLLESRARMHVGYCCLVSALLSGRQRGWSGLTSNNNNNHRRAPGWRETGRKRRTPPTEWWWWVRRQTVRSVSEDRTNESVTSDDSPSFLRATRRVFVVHCLVHSLLAASFSMIRSQHWYGLGQRLNHQTQTQLPCDQVQRRATQCRLTHSNRILQWINSGDVSSHGSIKDRDDTAVRKLLVEGKCL